MNFNYPGKYTDLKRFSFKIFAKIIHNPQQEINNILALKFMNS